MENIIIGTAGHIDHGKTTLIKALTGMETDTTAEEKKRGLSINLGFAYFDLPSGQRIGIVDVPGHEKFIKNMLAGLAGLNLILLVIDAGEGIMPQTKEHIDILTLLGIENFIIVVTKVDTVDAEMLALVKEDIVEQLAGTPLAEAPLVEVDSLSKKGLPTLIAEIEKASQHVALKNDQLPPRLNVDRVFSLKGFGTIVTGTLLEGTLSVGDDLMLYPPQKMVKVRNLQVHESDVQRAHAGQRTAINLTNIHTDELSRGDVLTALQNIEPTWMLDVKATLLKDSIKSLGLWDRVRLHLGAKEVLARVVPLGQNEILAGHEGFLQLRLEEQVAVKKGDKLIIRTYSPMTTIGGGLVLEANPAKHRRFNETILESLKVQEQGSLTDLISDFLRQKKEPLTSFSEIKVYLQLTDDELTIALNELLAAQSLLQFEQVYLDYTRYQQLSVELTDLISRYHKTYRLRKGIPKEELRSKMGAEWKGKVFDLFLQQLLADQKIKFNAGLIARFDFKVVYNKYQLADFKKIETALLNAKFTPPSDEQLTNGSEALQEVLDSMVGTIVIRLDHQTVIHQQYLDEAVQKVSDFIKTKGPMTLADFRDMTGSSRKYSMIILEYLDKIKLTKRVENTRELA